MKGWGGSKKRTGTTDHLCLAAVLHVVVVCSHMFPLAQSVSITAAFIVRSFLQPAMLLYNDTDKKKV